MQLPILRAKEPANQKGHPKVPFDLTQKLRQVSQFDPCAQHTEPVPLLGGSNSGGRREGRSPVPLQPKENHARVRHPHQ